ncbi:MAG: hypothetical protein WBB45_20710 [Cyclobacteriaceae bacterium]
MSTNSFRKILVATLFIALSATAAFAQELSVSPAGAVLLDYSQDLPESLRNKRTVVFVSAEGEPADDSKLVGWKELADFAHTYFRDAGIDAVAYFSMDEVFSGKDPERMFAERLSTRGVENLVILRRMTYENKLQYVLVVTPFAGEGNYMENGQKAYIASSPNLEPMLKQLVNTIKNSSSELANYLILDRPEFYGASGIITGEKFLRFNPDLKLDKLAVPEFVSVDMPEFVPDNEENQKVIRALEKLNEQAGRENESLKANMSAYPFEYKVGDYSKIEDRQIRLDGYQFVLKRLKGPAHTLREMLGYDAEGDTYTTTVWRNGEKTEQEIPANQQVYKYYIKHIFTGDVYLGTEWDAAASWEQALNNHFNNMKYALKTGTNP